MAFQGAGGTSGGSGRFFLGLVMIIAGGYLLLDAIHVTHTFGMGTALYRFGGFRVTSGLVLVPFIFGVGMVFYNAANKIGWGLIAASLIMLVAGVIANIQFVLRPMSVFDLLIILALFIGGIGLFISSLRKLS